MGRISQRELRNDTARVLRDLETHGESEITNNDTPVAILSPLTLEPIARMLRSGQASRPRSTRLPRFTRHVVDESTTDVLTELKGDH